VNKDEGKPSGKNTIKLQDFSPSGSALPRNDTKWRSKKGVEFFKGTPPAASPRDFFQRDESLDVVGERGPASYRAHINRSFDDPETCFEYFLREQTLEAKEIPDRGIAFPIAGNGFGCAYRPDISKDGLKDWALHKNGYLISPDFFPDHCWSLMPQPERGLIIICGETACGKSTFVRSLIFSALESLWKTRGATSQQPLHLITYEDPVEVPFWVSIDPLQPCWEKPENALVVSTHRSPGVNCHSLQDFFSSALRQKPAVTYIGEVRDIAEWDQVIDFAMTGHLAVTTSHASSIQDCLSKILLATKAEQNPAKRNFVAQALVAIIHLQSLSGLGPVEPGRGQGKLALPSMYLFNAKGTSRVIADNLDAILPGYADPCYGASYFLEKALDKADPTSSNGKKVLKYLKESPRPHSSESVNPSDDRKSAEKQSSAEGDHRTNEDEMRVQALRIDLGRHH
jgi:hypothetical protein